MADPVVRPTSGTQDANGNLTPQWGTWFNWVHQLVEASRQSGATAERPTRGLWIGRQFYDKTLGYPVWVHSITAGVVVWHNAAGASV